MTSFTWQTFTNYLRHHVIVRHVIVCHIIVLWCHVGDIHVFVSSCKCYSRLVNVCHGFVPSCIRYFCHANVFHANACHAIMCHAIVASCKCLSCKRGHVNERHKSASSCVPSWLHENLAHYLMLFPRKADKHNMPAWVWICTLHGCPPHHVLTNLSLSMYHKQPRIIDWYGLDTKKKIIFANVFL